MVKEFLEKVSDDWPSIFQPENLTALAAMSQADFARFLAEIRQKKAKIGVNELKRVVREYRQQQKAAAVGLEVLPGGGGNPEAAGKRTIISRFPQAKGIIPDDFPFPETGKGNTFFDVRKSRVVVVKVEYDESGGQRESVSPVADTVILLTRRLDPVEVDAGIEKWGVAWWERGRWKTADVPARYLFDRKRVAELVDVGIPTSSANVDDLITWLHALRALAVLGHQDAPELPTVRAVSRCGWHVLDGEQFFVVGPEILRPGGGSDGAEIQADAGAMTDQDVRWADDISAMERQILTSFRCGGDPEEQKKFLLGAMIRYPQVAFGIGCAAGAPLLRFAQAAGMIDVAGFCVFMVPRAGGRSRHQGKSTWNAVVASLFGWPGTGESGRLRFADRTRVAAGVLFGTNCDLTVHIEELQHLARASKKDAGQELAHLIHQIASGMDRERGARGGGGRRTKGFHTVLFGTAEVDVTVHMPVESGAHDRVMKLPPLLPTESDQNRDESERLTRSAMAHYGHAGREYLTWMVRQQAADPDFTSQVRDSLAVTIDAVRSHLPADSRRASAGRIATRDARQSRWQGWGC